jgi:hypothetical protein
MQYRPGLLDDFLTGTGIDLTPFSKPPPLKIVSGSAPGKRAS